MKTLHTMFCTSLKKHLWLFCALLWTIAAQATPVDPDIQRRIAEGSQQLKAMIAQNAWNNAHGFSHRNRYVFGDTKWIKVNDEAIGDDAAKEINELLIAYNTQTEANKVYDYNAVKVYLYLGGMQGFKVKPAPKHKTETKAELIARIKGGLLRKNYLNDKYAEASKKEAAVMNGIQNNVFGGLKRHKYSLMLGVATYLDVVPHKIAKEAGETMIWGVHRFIMSAGLKNTNKQLITVLRKLLKPHIGEVIKIEEGNTSQELAQRNRAEAMKNLTRAMLNEVGTCHPVDNPANIEYSVVDYGAPKDFKHPIGGKTLNDEDPATARKIWNESIQKVSARLNQELKKPGIYNLSNISLERKLHNWWNQAHFDWVAKESKFLSIDKQKVSKHGLSIYVVFIEIGFLPASQGDYSLKRFTNEVWRKTKLLKDNHKSVFYFVPLYYATYPGQNKRYGCAYPSLRLGTAYEPSDAKQIHDNIKDLRIKDLGKQLNAIYRALPKPYFEYGLICRVDGSILKASRSQLEVRGKPMRSVRVSYDSVNLARLQKMALQSYGTMLKARVRHLAAELLTESSVKDYRDMSAYDINLREDSMEEYYRHAAVRYLNNKFNELNVKSSSTSIEEYFNGTHYLFGNWKAIPNTAKVREGKDIVEELLEAASFIASFVNADLSFDLALGLYCAYKGKYVDSYLNFLGAAIPGFLDGFFKGEKLLLKRAAKQLRRSDLILAKVSKKGSKLIDDLLYSPLQKGAQWLINKSGDRLILSSLSQGVTKQVVIIDPTSIKIADDVPWGYATKQPNGKPKFLTENLALGRKQEVMLAQNKNGQMVKCFKDGTCFVAGTLIFEAKALRPIETIKSGDRVHSGNPQNCTQALKSVKATFVRTTPVLVKLDFPLEAIYTTPEHPFFDLNNQQILAGNLKAGDTLKTYDGYTIVRQARTIDTTATVYNFHVSDFHTYYVGNGKLWVHNMVGHRDFAKKVNNYPDFAKKYFELFIDEIKLFVDDFQKLKNLDDILTKFNKNPELVDAWLLLKKDGIEEAIRVNPQELQKVLDNLVDIKKVGYKQWANNNGIKIKPDFNEILGTNVNKKINELKLSGNGFSDKQIKDLVESFNKNDYLKEKLNQNSRLVSIWKMLDEAGETASKANVKELYETLAGLSIIKNSEELVTKGLLKDVLVYVKANPRKVNDWIKLREKQFSQDFSIPKSNIEGFLQTPNRILDLRYLSPQAKEALEKFWLSPNKQLYRGDSRAPNNYTTGFKSKGDLGNPYQHVLEKGSLKNQSKWISTSELSPFKDFNQRTVMTFATTNSQKEGFIYFIKSEFTKKSIRIKDGKAFDFLETKSGIQACDINKSFDAKLFKKQNEFAFEGEIPINMIEGAIYVRYKASNPVGISAYQIIGDFIPAKNFATFDLTQYKKQLTQTYGNY